jgi:hypothetical protein
MSSEHSPARARKRASLSVNYESLKRLLTPADAAKAGTVPARRPHPQIISIDPMGIELDPEMLCSNCGARLDAFPSKSVRRLRLLELKCRGCDHVVVTLQILDGEAAEPPVNSIRPMSDKRAAKTGTDFEQFFTPKEASQVLRRSVSWLAKRRMDGTGPAYTKAGRSVLYTRTGLLNYTRSRQRWSTSER